MQKIMEFFKRGQMRDSGEWKSLSGVQGNAPIGGLENKVHQKLKLLYYKF